MWGAGHRVGEERPNVSSRAPSPRWEEREREGEVEVDRVKVGECGGNWEGTGKEEGEGEATEAAALWAAFEGMVGDEVARGVWRGGRRATSGSPCSA